MKKAKRTKTASTLEGKRIPLSLLLSVHPCSSGLRNALCKLRDARLLLVPSRVEGEFWARVHWGGSFSKLGNSVQIILNVPLMISLIRSDHNFAIWAWTLFQSKHYKASMGEFLKRDSVKDIFLKKKQSNAQQKIDGINATIRRLLASIKNERDALKREKAALLDQTLTPDDLALFTMFNIVSPTFDRGSSAARAKADRLLTDMLDVLAAPNKKKKTKRAAKKRSR